MPFIKPFEKKDHEHESTRRVESGALENARKTLAATLHERFGKLPADALDALATINDPRRLTAALRAAVKSRTLEEFLSAVHRSEF